MDGGIQQKKNANECFSEFQKIISSYINKSTTFKKITSNNFRLKEWIYISWFVMLYST